MDLKEGGFMIYHLIGFGAIVAAYGIMVFTPRLRWVVSLPFYLLFFGGAVLILKNFTWLPIQGMFLYVVQLGIFLAELAVAFILAFAAAFAAHTFGGKQWI